MQTIWKFPITIDDELFLDMPEGSSILMLGVQGGMPCIWAKVNARAALVRRTFRVFGTGHEIKSDAGSVLNHIGSIQSPGCFVWHVFEQLAAA
jgi:hypothetical protein